MPQELVEDLLTFRVPMASGGINKDIEPTSLQGIFTPSAKNMFAEARKWRKRLGYRRLGSNLPLAGIGAALIDYVDARGTVHTIAVTTTHAFEYQTSIDMWSPITPSKFLDDCESGWTAGSNVTVAHDTSSGNRTRGSASLKMTLDAEASDGNQLAYKDISSVDASAMTHIGFWLKADADIPADDIEIVVSESNHAAGEKTGTYVECLNTALTADTWTFVCLAKTLTDFNAVVSVSVYANDTIANGTVIWLDDVRAFDELAGSATIPVHWALATDINEFTNNGGLALIVSNGVDDLFQYEGHANDVFSTLVHGYTDFANCVDIEEFWNHFMLINFNNGSDNVRSVANADIGNIDEWAVGTSGLAYLTDSRGDLMRGVKLGSELILYSERSITTCRYYGTTTLFIWPTLIHQTGLFTHGGVIQLSDRHQLIGTDQRIYEYSGGRQLKSIGKAIAASFFDELDNSKKAHIVCGNDEMRDRSYFCFPRAQDTYANAAYCINRRQPENPWEYLEFADDIRGIASFVLVTDTYCDDSDLAGIYCDEVSWYCDASTGQTAYPVMITLDSAGYVFKHDEALGKDDDANIECEYQTDDIRASEVAHVVQSVGRQLSKEYSGRWQWLVAEMKSSIAGGTVSVFYSTDEGETWTEFDDSPVTLTSAWAVTELPFDVTSRKVRIRFYQNSAADLQIKDDMYVGLILKPPRV